MSRYHGGRTNMDLLRDTYPDGRSRKSQALERPSFAIACPPEVRAFIYAGSPHHMSPCDTPVPMGSLNGTVHQGRPITLDR